MTEDNRNNDPYLSCKFHVEIDGIIAAGFSDVSGMQTEIETEDHREGGRNDYVFKFRKINKYQNIILKRGFTSSDALWKWHLRVVAGNIERKTI
ncbi:MAG: phage tail protein, partial [bacterium]|nr:phage tail protein [bacterium]